jgi:hypothetical protein
LDLSKAYRYVRYIYPLIQSGKKVFYFKQAKMQIKNRNYTDNYGLNPDVHGAHQLHINGMGLKKIMIMVIFSAVGR